MDWMDRLTLFDTLDFAAVAGLLLTWLVAGYLIEHPPKSRPSVSVLMSSYRRDWMRQFVDRDPRIFDSQMLTILRQGTSFFASASMIAIGAGLALIGNTERLVGVATDLTLDTAPAIVWEIKIVLALFFVANAFLKFVWSHRLFGYCAVVMGSVPNDPSDPQAGPRGDTAADLNIYASRSFNRGMRSLYFAMAAVTWLAGPHALILGTLATGIMLWRREFASQSRAALLHTSS
ncbi:Uncharacterized membrane protein [Salinihabitans flavidus]|uniref:Uncharacterized membrane protein n=1 Tax=Salinihabitans flavidus TaxID=569882 RepID=A0A1H8S6I1_9RHOB|nr:DUF599 domain-containing protein [Salinihabitans flavidus]SEO74619.1 Uncharacterized membrane protein [Salinihabitans flavidus]